MHGCKLTWYSERPEGTLITVRVQPRASRQEIGGPSNGVLCARLNAPPVEGRANEALVRLLSDMLGVPKSRVRIEGGQKGRLKKVFVEGLGPEEIARRLDLSRSP